ncbi:MAG: hypothetical protein ACI8QS_000849 [Planctomycetota bacterium]
MCRFLWEASSPLLTGSTQQCTRAEELWVKTSAVKTLSPKFEALIAEERDPRESEVWFMNLPVEKREAWTREWKDEIRQKVHLKMAQRRRYQFDSAQMGFLLLTGSLCTALSSPASNSASFLTGLALGYLCSRMDFERLLTILIVAPLWLLIQVITLHGISAMHFFVLFPLSCAVGYTAIRRSQRAFE